MNNTTESTPGHLLCFGLGYTAGRLAETLHKQGWKISGTTRSVERLEAMKALGYSMYLYDGVSPLPETCFRGITHILHSIPPGAGGDSVWRQHAPFITAHAEALQWMGYLSTTGVYGDAGGAWVDESSPLKPTNDRQRWRVKGEQSWLELYEQHAIAVHVFRLAGIYGEGRNALRALQEGKARRIDRPQQYFSRIHVEDIVQVLERSLQRPAPGGIYNVCDDRPAPQAEVVSYAAALLGITPPPLQTLEAADLSPMARSFYQSSRRVRNNKIKKTLGVKLQYPDYTHGLKALLSTV